MFGKEYEHARLCVSEVGVIFCESLRVCVLLSTPASLLELFTGKHTHTDTHTAGALDVRCCCCCCWIKPTFHVDLEAFQRLKFEREHRDPHSIRFNSRPEMKLLLFTVRCFNNLLFLISWC